MNIPSILVASALVVFAAGCNTMRTTSEQDSNYDFNPVKTYQWVDGPADLFDDVDAYIHQDIRNGLTAVLSQRGLRAVENEDEAQLKMVHYVKLTEDYEYTEASPVERDFSGGFVYRRDTKNWHYAEREPDLNAYVVETGTLTVLAYDAQTGLRVWRGTLSTEIKRGQSPAEQAERIRLATQKLMSQFPVRP